MDELIIRDLQGYATADESAQVRAWRRESPANDAHYLEIARIWADLPDTKIETTPPPTSRIIARAEAPEVIPIGTRRPARLASALRMMAIAASIGVVLATGQWARRILQPAGSVLQIQQLATDASETLMTQLSDGTTVYLAPSSRLKVSSTPGVREVWLEGRAFFGVARHGAEWPFVVRTDRGRVHVLGTRFELSTEGENLRVVVVDGSVDFATSGEGVQLTSGQMSIAEADTEPVVVQVENVESMLEWMGQSLVFENTPLAKVAREIELRYDATVVIADDELARRTISGGFKNRSFTDLVSIICRVTSAECVVGDAHAVLSAPSH